MNLALNPDFPFRILFHTFTIFLQSCNLIPAWKAPRPRYLIHSSWFGHINIGLSILMQTCKRLINRWRGHYHNCHHQSPQDKEDWIHVWSVALSLGGPTCAQYMYLPEYSRLKIYCRTLTHNHQMHLLKAGKFQVYLSHVLVACAVGWSFSWEIYLCILLWDESKWQKAKVQTFLLLIGSKSHFNILVILTLKSRFGPGSWKFVQKWPIIRYIA